MANLIRDESLSEHERQLRFEWRDGWYTGCVVGIFIGSFIGIIGMVIVALLR